MLKIILVFAVCFFALANATVITQRFFSHPDHPGKCVIMDKVLTAGQSIKHPVMECAEFTCDNSQGLGTIETCLPVQALASPLNELKGYDINNPPTCTWGNFVNTKAAYPACCKRHYSCVF